MPDRLVRLPLVAGGEVAVRPDDVVLVRSVVEDGQVLNQCYVVFENGREHVALAVEETVIALNVGRSPRRDGRMRF